MSSDTLEILAWKQGVKDYIDYVADQHVEDDLYTFTVIMEEKGHSGWEYFVCEAEDGEHAEEQALNANPDHEVLWVNRGLNFSMESVYDVTIEATVQKTIRVNASSEEEAVELAHSQFSVLNDGIPENYDENMVDVVKVSDE